MLTVPLAQHLVNKVSPRFGQYEGIEFTYVIEEPEIYESLSNANHELTYSFTYCVERIDCDTQKYYL